MPKQQTTITPPTKSDTELKDFASVIQNNIATLFSGSHQHSIRTSIPTAGDGNVGDIFIVTVGSSSYLYAKISQSSWLKAALS